MAGPLERSSLILQRLESFGRQAAEGASQDAEALANSLAWTSENLESRRIGFGNGSEDITRVTSGGQGVAVFSFSFEAESDQLVRTAALYAYQASIDWGLVGNRDSLTIFNSHWLRKGHWFELPPIKWAHLRGSLDILDGFTPDGMRDGLIERVAARFPSADRILLPVDDALVERLEYWRKELARFAPKMAKADEAIHKLFAQFFVLRAVEDRHLARGLEPLSSSLLRGGSRPLDKPLLDSIFSFARMHLQTDLFSTDTISDVPAEILAGIIEDLYHPKHLPYDGARYNFSWIDADVLGRAYEKYLSQILLPSSVPSQLNLLEEVQPVREVETTRNKRSAGIYYTPSFLVSYLVKQSVDRQLALRPEVIPKVIDPSCGSGSFLTSCVGYLSQVLRKRNPGRNWVRELVATKSICGIDSDPRAVLLAKLSLWLRITEEPDPLPLPALDQVVFEGDGLSEASWEELGGHFDIVLGNPPFVPTGVIPDRADLEARFQSARGRFDYAYLFLEMAIRHLNPHGVVAMVLPNRLFRNKDAGATRAMLVDSVTLNTIADFGSHEVFRGVSAYIGTVIATKGKRAVGNDNVRVVKVAKMAPRLMNLILSAGSQEESTNAFLESFDIQQPSSPGPWLFLSPAVLSARMRLENSSVPLSELAEVFQGIKVGANDIFIVTIVSDALSTVVQIRNGLGETYLVESELLHPVTFGANIDPYSRVAPKLYLLYTYILGVVIDEEELAKSYPMTLAYLQIYRPFLSRRVSVIESGRRWYELVRHRDQTKLDRPKLLMRDMAISTAYAIDESGSTYLVGGTAVVPGDPALLKPLLGYLNSQLVNWFLSPITPSFRGAFQKFEPQHVASIPVLTEIFENPEVQEQLSSLVDMALSAKQAERTREFDEVSASIDRLLGSIVGIDTTI